MAIDKSTYEGLFLHRCGPFLRSTPFLYKLTRDRIIAESKSHPEFADNLRKMSLSILQDSSDMRELHKALSALSVVGTKEDEPLIETLHKFRNENLSIDIKTCLYNIKHNNPICDLGEESETAQ